MTKSTGCFRPQETVPEELLNILAPIAQTHLLEFWDTLTTPQKKYLTQQILALDTVRLSQQQALLRERGASETVALEPFQDYAEAGSPEDREQGRRRIFRGKIGCLVVAGGQGSRFGFDGPKGMFPVTPVTGKTLFQLLAEKVVDATQQAGRLLPLAVMTSQKNHAQTVAFFQEHGRFGLLPEQLSFFPQDSLPFLDDDGKMFLQGPDTIAQGPSGNGTSLRHFVDSGIWSEWRQQGVDYVNFIQIDNPLADPFDAELLGYHCRQNSDVTIKCTPRCSPKENVGLVVKDSSKTRVVEYSEMPPEERQATQHDGALKHLCANISLFCFNMDFIKQTADKTENSLPWHLANKTTDAQGSSVMAWKFEKFIFDVLPLAEKVGALLYPREDCFSPLKNASGPDSLQTVQKALQQKGIK